jgi:O-acetyl-ADP-ribose deacetylase
MSDTIAVVRADITTLAVDAIVNPVDPTMSGGAPGTVDGAVHAAAGPRMAEACAFFAPCPVGRARITPGFRLPATWVIHTSGPVWRGGHHHEDRDLESCYLSALSLASIYDARKIAFPAISTGTFGFPAERAARIAVQAIGNYLEQDATVQQVLLVCRGTETEAALRHALASTLVERQETRR